MQRHSRFAAAALAGIVTAGSLAATLTSVSPALADSHRGGRGYDARNSHADNRGNQRDDRNGYARGYQYQSPQPAYVYQAPAYPYQGYQSYPAPVYGYEPQSNGYLHVSAPGFSLGVGF